MRNHGSAPDLAQAVEAEHTRLTIPSRPEWIEKTVEYLGRRALAAGVCEQSRISKIELALHEAITNSIVHGNLGISSALKEQGDDAFAEVLAKRASDPELSDRPVTITVDYDGQRCRWTLADVGNGFDISKVNRQENDDGPEEEDDLLDLLSSGRGILLMSSFMDEVHFSDGGRCVSMTVVKPEGGEKRQHTRTPMNQPLRVAPVHADGTIDWDAIYSVLSRDLSKGGIALVQSRLADARRLMVELPGADSPTYVPAEICRVSAVGEGIVELGCRFDANTPAGEPSSGPAARGSDFASLQEAIGTLLGELSTADIEHDDRRLHVRAAYTERIGIITDVDPPPKHAFARDLSKGGIAFISTFALPRGPLCLTLPRGNGPVLKVRARVVRCDEITSGFFDVGAQFLGWS